MKNIFHYAKGIRRLQGKLRITVSEFPQFGLVGRITIAEEEEQNLSGQSYAHTQNETENYELLEQNQREPDLTEEREEYFRRIRQESWILVEGFSKDGKTLSNSSIICLALFEGVNLKFSLTYTHSYISLSSFFY
jgi:hypothetical protein